MPDDSPPTIQFEKFRCLTAVLKASKVSPELSGEEAAVPLPGPDPAPDEAPPDSLPMMRSKRFGCLTAFLLAAREEREAKADDEPAKPE